MPRLIDDIRASGARLAMPWFVQPKHEKKWVEICSAVHNLILTPDLPVLLIDNVADYYYSSDQEYWDLRDHFPNLAPPYQMFWMEHKLPKRIHSKECGDTDMSALVPKGRQGALITSLRREDVKGEDIPENAKWILWCELFMDSGLDKGITAIGPHGSMFFCVDSEGALIDLPWMASFADSEPEMADLLRHHFTQLHPTLLAISFLHCKNVSTLENVVDAPLAKKYQRRTGIAPTVYKTLVIEPLKQVLRREGRSHVVGIPQAIHLCRGHFADYREGRGLFGKYHQLVRIPQIVRGSRGAGAPPREATIKL